jgi:AbrB family looped-hinge helix DNA binding protein
MSVKVSQKFQVVIPEQARKALNLKPGMEVEVIVKGAIAYLVPLRTLADLKNGLSTSWEENDRRSIREKKDRKT